MLISLIGIFAVGCASFEKDTPQKYQTHFVQAADVGAQATIIRAVDATTVPDPATPTPVGIVDFLRNNVAVLTLALLTFFKVIVNLTPTESDNKIFGLLDNFINWIVPNFKVGGGKFT